MGLVYVFWIAGFMFTLGFCQGKLSISEDNPKTKSDRFSFGAALFIMWPMALGETLNKVVEKYVFKTDL